MTPAVKESLYKLSDYSQARCLAEAVLRELDSEQYPELIILASRVLSPRARAHQSEAA